MLSFEKFRLIVENTEQTVSGPGIKLLVHTFMQMGSRGVPNVYNDYGFSKPDYNAYQSIIQQSPNLTDQIPVRIATRMLEILSHYKKTQIKNFPQIQVAVRNDFQNAKLIHAEHQDKIVVGDTLPLVYGKMLLYVPDGLDRSNIIAVNRIVDKYLDATGAERVYDEFGKLGHGPHRFKVFSRDKDKLNSYRVHPKILQDVIALLQPDHEIVLASGRPLTALSQEKAPQVPEVDVAQKTKEVVEIIGFEDTRYGKRLAIRFNIPFEQSKVIFDSMKTAGLTPRAISYASNPSRFLITVPVSDNPTTLQTERKNYYAVRNKMGEKIDVSALDMWVMMHLADKLNNVQEASKPEIKFTDLEKDEIKIQCPFLKLEEGQRLFLRQLVVYTFPDRKWQGEPEYAYVVHGDYRQYAIFGQLLKRFGYNVDRLRQILKAKIASGRLQKTDWEGRSDPQFKEKLDGFTESKFDLYDAQKDGIEFLSSRKYAILGDETGLGKTVQLIYAAALKQKQTSRPVLIITLKNVRDQFVTEIKNVMGDDAKISIDPLTPTDWTVVYYENFSMGKKLKEVLESLKKTPFCVVIFDELHKLKHENAKRTHNITDVVAHIPIHWGASATISANKPIDVRNQLSVIGHPLGRVKLDKFKQDFAGYVPGGFGGAFKEGSFEQKVVAAENLNKWLNLTGLYIRRNKSDLRDMPNLSINSSRIDIDEDKVMREVEGKVADYRKPDLRISELIATREVIAKMKVNATVQRVIQIVARNQDKPGNNYAASKVVVFTNFIGASHELVAKLTFELRRLNPKYQVIQYLSDTKKAQRQRVKDEFTNNPMAKVLVMSMRMGGTGIDFPNTSQNMVINDFDWTPEAAEQSEGRIYRINTNHPVNIQYIVANGFDTELFERVQKKRELASVIQKYRREYHGSEHNPEALKKLVEKQKEFEEVGAEMASIENHMLDKIHQKTEASKNFRSYILEASSKTRI